MRKFDFFNQYWNPVIIVRDYEKVVFRNNAFRRVFNTFEDIRKFAHRMNFEICPMDSDFSGNYFKRKLFCKGVLFVGSGPDNLL